MNAKHLWIQRKRKLHKTPRGHRRRRWPRGVGSRHCIFLYYAGTPNLSCWEKRGKGTFAKGPLFDKNKYQSSLPYPRPFSAKLSKRESHGTSQANGGRARRWTTVPMEGGCSQGLDDRFHSEDGSRSTSPDPDPNQASWPLRIDGRVISSIQARAAVCDAPLGRQRCFGRLTGLLS